MNTVLSIAGSDPSGGAGLQADLKVFRAMGTHGLSVPTVLTAQNTRGVREILEIPSDFYLLQLETLLTDITPDAIKIGMLYAPDITDVTARKIRERQLNNIVVDPMTVSSTGMALSKKGTLEAIRDQLFPIARVITPNIDETYTLTGEIITTGDDMKEAAITLKRFGPEAVIITGGHLKNRAFDLLFDGEDFIEIESERLPGDYHGTGCVFSSAVAAGLAVGYDVKESALKAKDLVLQAIEKATAIGKGMKLLNI